MLFCHYCLYPFSTTYPGCSGYMLIKVDLMSFTPVTTSSSPRGGGHPGAFPGQMGYVTPPVWAGSALGSSSHCTCLEHLNQEASGEQTTSTGVFYHERGVVRVPTEIWAHPVHEGEPRLREKKTHFSLLNLWSHYFSHCEDLLTV